MIAPGASSSPAEIASRERDARGRRVWLAGCTAGHRVRTVKLMGERNRKETSMGWRRGDLGAVCCDPAGIIPAQARSLAGPSLLDLPPLRLMEAVLARAVSDYLVFGSRPGRRAQAAFATVRSWIVSRETDSPFSFERICEVLDLEAEAVRQGLARRLAAVEAGDGRKHFSLRHCAGRRLTRTPKVEAVPARAAA
jgi:hypothetical protein